MKKGDLVQMSNDALENYGEKWRGVELRITHKATAYMSAAQFFAQGKPEGFHPGYDDAGKSPLFDLEIAASGKALGFSLYSWELTT